MVPTFVLFTPSHFWNVKKKNADVDHYKRNGIMHNTNANDIDERGDFTTDTECIRFCSGDTTKNWNIQTFRYFACHRLNYGRDRFTIADDISACLPLFGVTGKQYTNQIKHIQYFFLCFSLFNSSSLHSFSLTNQHIDRTQVFLVVHRMLFRLINFVLIASKLAFTYSEYVKR